MVIGVYPEMDFTYNGEICPRFSLTNIFFIMLFIDISTIHSRGMPEIITRES